MKKKIIIMVGMTLALLTIVLSGCTSTKTNEEKILGSWITEGSIGQEETAVFNFFSNGTFSLELTVNELNLTTFTIWETYTITDESIVMILGNVTETLEYSFSEGDDILTLIEDNGEQTVLVRQ